MGTLELIKLIILIAAIALTILVLFVLIVFKIQISSIKRRTFLNGKVIESPYGTIEYTVVGAGIPVLISHATLGGYDQGILLSEAFVSSGYRFVIPSRFGYLQSDLPKDDSYEAQADVFEYLLKKLDIEKAFVLGMSAGGPPAIQFAIRHPERCSGLILLSSAAYAPSSEKTQRKIDISPQLYRKIINSDLIFWLILHISKSWLENAFGATQKIKRKSTKEDLELLDRSINLFLPVSKRSKGAIMDDHNVNSLERMSLEKICSPTLVICAEDDNAAPLEWGSYTARHIYNSMLITYKSGGHFILGHSNEIKKSISEFIIQSTDVI